MRFLKRTVAVLGVLLVIAVAGLAIAISRTTSCEATPAATNATGATPDATTILATQRRCYGPPSSVEVARIALPPLDAGRVRVRVHVGALNPLDWHYMRGEPYPMRLSSGLGKPTEPRLGSDFAGVVEAVGAGVTRFAPGDRVFGARDGSLGEVVDVREAGSLARIPDGVSFDQAAALPVAAITALQALRDKGGIKSGDRVLIIGASGGVGTYAVQLAAAMGAQVSGVSSARNAELVRSLGGTEVIDYTREDFTLGQRRFDVVLDNIGDRSLLDIRRVMTSEGRYIVVGGPSDGPWFGAIATLFKASVIGLFVSQHVEPFLAETTSEDLDWLALQVQQQRLRPVIDRRYPLARVAEAITYLETGRARGKVLIDVQPAAEAPAMQAPAAAVAQ